MKPTSFEYSAPSHFDEVIEMLGRHGEDVKLLAGGQSLIPMLNMRLSRPRVIIDLGELPDHEFITQENGMIRVGFRVTQQALYEWPGLADSLPLIKQAIPFVGHRQTRNRGTVVGSIAHADPSAELPLCMAALNGEAILSSKTGERTVCAKELQLGLLETQCRSDEIIRELRFPEIEPGARVSFLEEAPRHGDFAVVSVAAIAYSSGLTLAFGGISDKPVVCTWGKLALLEMRDKLQAFAADFVPYSDQHASKEYRCHLMYNLGFRAIQEVS